MVLTSPPKKSKSASCPHRVHGNYFVVCAPKSLSGDSDAQNSGQSILSRLLPASPAQAYL